MAPKRRKVQTRQVKKPPQPSPTDAGEAIEHQKAATTNKEPHVETVEVESQSSVHGGDSNVPGEAAGEDRSEAEDSSVIFTEDEAAASTIDEQLDDDEDEDLWANGKEEKLIDLYRSCPFLYDKGAPGYNLKKKKALTYVKFSKELGIPVKSITARIKTLRDAYTRATGKQASGSARRSLTARNKYIVRVMCFINDHVRPRQTTSSMQLPAQQSVDSGGMKDAVQVVEDVAEGIRKPDDKFEEKPADDSNPQEPQAPTQKEPVGESSVENTPSKVNRKRPNTQEQDKHDCTDDESPRSPTPPPPKRPVTTKKNLPPPTAASTSKRPTVTSVKRNLSRDDGPQSADLIRTNFSSLPSVMSTSASASQNVGAAPAKSRGRGKNRYLTVEEAKELESKRNDALGEISGALRDATKAKQESAPKSETEKWAELLALKVDRLPEYVKDDFKFRVDEMVYKAGKGLWHPSIPTTTERGPGDQSQDLYVRPRTVIPPTVAPTSSTPAAANQPPATPTHLNARPPPVHTPVMNTFTSQEINELQQILSQSPRIGPQGPTAVQVPDPTPRPSPHLADKLHAILGGGQTYREYEGPM